jgi:hypothetical protein
MSHSTELRQRLEAGITELEGDIARLRAAVAALDASDGVPARTRSRRAGPAPKAAPAYDVVPSGKLASLLSSSDDGMTTSELAQRTNGKPDQVLELLKELEEAGRARRSGVRRSTRWHSPAAASGGRKRASADVPGDRADPAETEEQVQAALQPVVAS